MTTPDPLESLTNAVARRLSSASLEPRVLTLTDAALYMGLTEEALRAKASAGAVRVTRIDRLLRFDRRDLDTWIDNSKE